MGGGIDVGGTADGEGVRDGVCEGAADSGEVGAWSQRRRLRGSSSTAEDGREGLGGVSTTMTSEACEAARGEEESMMTTSGDARSRFGRLGITSEQVHQEEGA